jgi:hypothetical protein
MCAQGRARPSLARLYNWRYKDLGDLPFVCSAPQFLRANAGFAYDFQFIDVPDYHGRGESEPVPYFYQVRSHVPCPCMQSPSAFLVLTLWNCPTPAMPTCFFCHDFLCVMVRAKYHRLLQIE